MITFARIAKVVAAVVAFVLAGSACVFHASIDTECWYAPKQPPPQSTQTTDHNETSGNR